MEYLTCASTGLESQFTSVKIRIKNRMEFNASFLTFDPTYKSPSLKLMSFFQIGGYNIESEKTLIVYFLKKRKFFARKVILFAHCRKNKKVETLLFLKGDKQLRG